MQPCCKSRRVEPMPGAPRSVPQPATNGGAEPADAKQ